MNSIEKKEKEPNTHCGKCSAQMKLLLTISI